MRRQRMKGMDRAREAETGGSERKAQGLNGWRERYSRGIERGKRGEIYAESGLIVREMIDHIEAARDGQLQVNGK